MSSQMCRLLDLCLVLIVVTPAIIFAQESPQNFSLPEAHVGETYRVELKAVLRDKYGLKIDSGTKRAIIQWTLADGELPPGLLVTTDGTIVGTPQSTRTETYRCRLKVIDVTVKGEELFLEFEVIVKPRTLRLSKIEGPRLVTAGMSVSATDNGLSKADSTSTSPATDLSSGRDTEAISTGRNKSAGQPKVDEGDRNGNEVAADQKEINNPFSSLNKRLIVGFEQTGAAASGSTGKPFFDIFINTPLSRNSSPCDSSLKANERGANDEVPCLPPRFSVWGDVRLTSTPEQVTALGAVASNALGTITDAKFNQIASAFDFVVGPEVRLQRFNHTDLSLIAGFGAISPISPKQSAQIFQVPDASSSQAPDFFKMYPGAQSKQFIAFVTPDRDRFLRQYFGGFRFKTFKYEGEQLQDVFPATFDITFGQNEAVTGGRLRKFVVGFDGFYPLPFPDNSRFLYLFGSARFKAGGPKNIGTPFILDTAASSVSITDPKVFIADPTPSNRDTYRIGFGVDLVELFKFAKAQGKDQGRNEQKKEDLRNQTNH